LDALLEEATIISVHTPLTTDGEYPTFHLLDAYRLGLMRAGSVLINSSRGAVVDHRALLSRLKQDDITAV
jgi:erythronate-4-phosphate dehydrogenase